MKTTKAEAILKRGRALIGVRFRPQGRSAETGLDCIGVAAMAMGFDPAGVRRDYALHSGDAEVLHAELDACGMVRLAPNEVEPGDIAVAQAGPRQLHIVLVTDTGYLHADVALRRVVEVPAPLPWPMVSAWRCPDDGVVAVRMA